MEKGIVLVCSSASLDFARKLLEDCKFICYRTVFEDLSISFRSKYHLFLCAS